MLNVAYLKRRLGQYAGLWVAGFALAGAGVLIGLWFIDLIAAIDMVLPVLLGLVALGLAGGLTMSLFSEQTLGTKLVLVILSLLLVLPLLWAPVSAAVAIAFFADRSIEYSTTYADFQVAIARLLFPISQAIGDGDLFGWVWTAFQWVASVVGFISALSNIWPLIRRLLGPEPAPEA